MIDIVDPHVHIWDLKTGLYPRRQKLRDAGDSSIADYLVDDLLADASSVRLRKAVHVEAFPTDGLAEVRHVHALADAAPSGLPQGIVANVELARPDLDALLDQLTAFPRARGIRHAPNRPGEDRNLLDEPQWRSGFGRLHAHGLSFDLQLAPQQVPAAAKLVADHPGTAIAINHLGWPKERGFAKWREWRAGLRQLAVFSNVHIKLSGVGMFEPDWTAESIRPYVFEAIDLFGVRRAMFASNFPVDRRWRSYAAIWQAFATLVAELSPDDQAALLGGNAERFYRI